MHAIENSLQSSRNLQQVFIACTEDGTIEGLEKKGTDQVEKGFTFTIFLRSIQDIPREDWNSKLINLLGLPYVEDFPTAVV